jgi:hypothetical protein
LVRALVAGLARLQADDSGEAAFERSLDDFLAVADARYSRSRADAEALFYLAHANMLRAAYRLSEDKVCGAPLAMPRGRRATRSNTSGSIPSTATRI